MSLVGLGGKVFCVMFINLCMAFYTKADEVTNPYICFHTVFVMNVKICAVSGG